MSHNQAAAGVGFAIPQDSFGGKPVLQSKEPRVQSGSLWDLPYPSQTVAAFSTGLPPNDFYLNIEANAGGGQWHSLS